MVVGVGISALEESLMSKGQKPRGPDEEFPSGLVLSVKFKIQGTLDFADNTVSTCKYPIPSHGLKHVAFPPFQAPANIHCAESAHNLAAAELEMVDVNIETPNV